MTEERERRRAAGNLAWVDLEMTGLDPEHHVILQAALIVTDSELSPLETWTGDVWQPDVALDAMVPVVRQMHEKNGLLDRVRASTLDVREAERQLLSRVSGWCEHPAILCGNTIGSDRKFIDRYMPGLAGYLHYRMIDVTSVKLLARSWYGESAQYEKPTDAEHDALFDIQQSIAELLHYRKTLFR